MESKQPKARVLAYYLPQFHPIPENDEWWGKGFTEWTNVGKAKPLFPGHYQPRVPADLGYYDLRVPEVREAQAQMAHEAGIEGFIYWHYWFGNGKRLLERPFDEVLNSGKPEFPFALAWANETWSGFAHGIRDNKQILMEQTYPGEDDYIEHFKTVLPAFKDKRYITCDGKPIFIVYHLNQLPEPKKFVEIWQRLAKDNGLRGIYFIAYYTDCYGEKNEWNALNTAKACGFDAINIVYLHNQGQVKNYPKNPRGVWRWIQYEVMCKWLKIWPQLRYYDPNIFQSVLDYRDDVIPSVVPCWDHTPRTGKRGFLFLGSNPSLFAESVSAALERIRFKPAEHKFLFIKSWNEWAEGNYMEPDLKYGRGFLEALRNNLYEDKNR